MALSPTQRRATPALTALERFEKVFESGTPLGGAAPGFGPASDTPRKSLDCPIKNEERCSLALLQSFKPLQVERVINVGGLKFSTDLIADCADEIS
ncbi:MAG TPA: hypothetical protein VGC77_13500 [Rhodopseudomonas sp.]|uniref:hypothetical protein n=1 Tax=Rhodopseudomonas sp. TaxID=1078 RepID=UPI002EDA3FB4